jgi:hypothetical protein
MTAVHKNRFSAKEVKSMKVKTNVKGGGVITGD